MKLLGVRQLSVLLVGTVLLCHGAFGGLHLVCYPPECAGKAEHHAAAPGAHKHPADHGTSTGYFAVLAVVLLRLLLSLFPRGTPLRIMRGARWPAVLRVPAVLRPPPTLTPPLLQVFRL